MNLDASFNSLNMIILGSQMSSVQASQWFLVVPAWNITGPCLSLACTAPHCLCALDGLFVCQ